MLDHGSCLASMSMMHRWAHMRVISISCNRHINACVCIFLDSIELYRCIEIMYMAMAQNVRPQSIPSTHDPLHLWGIWSIPVIHAQKWQVVLTKPVFYVTHCPIPPDHRGTIQKPVFWDTRFLCAVWCIDEIWQWDPFFVVRLFFLRPDSRRLTEIAMPETRMNIRHHLYPFVWCCPRHAAFKMELTSSVKVII